MKVRQVTVVNMQSIIKYNFFYFHNGTGIDIRVLCVPCWWSPRARFGYKSFKCCNFMYLGLHMMLIAIKSGRSEDSCKTSEWPCMRVLWGTRFKERNKLRYTYYPTIVEKVLIPGNKFNGQMVLKVQQQG